ncbi:hypothetical protein C8R42DRAFT_727103 [Lentinula raphanica]|nr:hypothetical protein C8R42DRAFT_727103 [Lentinula raphanica]
MAFSGSLKYKTKRDMIDIAFALGVESEGTSAQVLRVHLHSHFEAYPALKEDPRYIGLFTRKRKRADAFKENELPPAHRHSPMPLSPTPSLSHTPSLSQVLHSSGLDPSCPDSVVPSADNIHRPRPHPRPHPRPLPHPLPLSHTLAYYQPDYSASSNSFGQYRNL